MAFDPTREGQLTEDQLKWGYWWVTHKVQVRKIFAIALVVLDVALVGYGSFGFIDWFFLSGARERQEIGLLAETVTDFPYFHARFAPRELAIEGTSVLEAGEGSYDLATRVANPNPQWWANFNYQFLSGSEPLGALQRGYILPGEVKYLSGLGTKAASFPSGAEVAITDLVWHRVNNHIVRPDYAVWSAARLNFLLSDIKFQAPDPSDQLKVSRASFTLKNDSGYGYWKVGFFVALLRGEQVVAANYVTVSELRAGDVRPVEASWFSDLPPVDRVEITPEVNLFDDRVFIPPGQ
ncbi:MAG: hypothetical protein WCT10_02880 [Patescibacteria group bacterium]|jgi:hypothetical protein